MSLQKAGEATDKMAEGSSLRTRVEVPKVNLVRCSKCRSFSRGRTPKGQTLPP
ncbi:hypothetical protein GHT06_008481 [Daphnia sinensis]|uniref:Uncharacterized protein n=1 Tax=Daphnia sinensis TaxID=1820382 RepID=A0AAD5LMH5_9CRUS|nr:hypothetical protein GHT06_008481 [Daphnia sinensis]